MPPSRGHLAGVEVAVGVPDIVQVNVEPSRWQWLIVNSGAGSGIGSRDTQEDAMSIAQGVRRKVVSAIKARTVHLDSQR